MRFLAAAQLVFTACDHRETEVHIGIQYHIRPLSQSPIGSSCCK